MKKWYDVTVPVKSGMLHWPGDPDIDVKRIANFSQDGVNISAIDFGLHTGTHMDAPLHFIEHGDDITKVPPELLIGKTKVIIIEHPEYIGREELEGKDISGCERLLFRTKNSARKWFEEEFRTDYIYLTDEAARYIASSGIKLIGIDYLSVGEYKNGRETHRILLGKKIWIIEGLYLSEVEEGEYDLYALPLLIEGADGSPVRVILSREEQADK